MYFISHRGNISGPVPGWENSPDYINDTLAEGFDVEVDVWYNDGKFYLGHDAPIHEIRDSFLKNSKLWCHAKNISALDEMLKRNIHCFYHNKDKVTLTSEGIIWPTPNEHSSKNSIIVMPEMSNSLPSDLKNYLGICSDYIRNWREQLGN